MGLEWLSQTCRVYLNFRFQMPVMNLQWSHQSFACNLMFVFLAASQSQHFVSPVHYKPCTPTTSSRIAENKVFLYETSWQSQPASSGVSLRTGWIVLVHWRSQNACINTLHITYINNIWLNTGFWFINHRLVQAVINSSGCTQNKMFLSSG